MYYCKYINEKKVKLCDKKAVVKNGIIIGNPSEQEIIDAGYLPLICEPPIDFTEINDDIGIIYTLRDGCVYAAITTDGCTDENSEVTE